MQKTCWRQDELLTVLCVYRGATVRYEDLENWLETDRRLIHRWVCHLRRRLAPNVIIELHKRVGYKLIATPLQYANIRECLR